MKKAEARAKSKVFYDMQVDMNEKIRRLLADADIDTLEENLGAYFQVMVTPIEEGDDEKDTVEVSKQMLQQMATLAAASLSGVICRRYRAL